MSDVFDPFHEWLGIPPVEQPPNYYRLLGLSVFESDLAAIQLAAKRGAILVQPHIAGPHGALAQKLLQQINAARLLLSSADKKATYDAALRQKRAAITPHAIPSSKLDKASKMGGTISGNKVRVLGEYRILSKIGAGGMGQVYKAEHLRMRRTVALKVLAPQAMKSPDSVGRFNREVQAAARLSHPNIVTAHDAGEQQGIHYLVMEYVEGSDLSTLVREHGALDVAFALECVVQAACGLEYAHSEGIIHRDIKPANILVDNRGTVKILDLGLARFDDRLGSSEALTSAGLTASGQIMGTVEFMSPEQAEDTRSVDARSDIYSLGCTLFFLLTGEGPFPGDTVMKKLLAHRDKEIPSLAARRPDIPKQLDDVFQRMVAKKADDRFPSMTELITALEACRASQDAAVGARAEDAAKRAPFRDSMRKLTASGSAGGTRSSTTRSRSQEATVNLRGSSEETKPRLINQLVGTVNRYPKVATVAGIGVLLIAIVVLWIGLSSENRPLPTEQRPALNQNENLARTVSIAADAKTLNPTVAGSSDNASVMPSAEGQWLDVLSLIDLDKYPPRRGIWSREANGLQHAAETGVVGFLPLPLSVQGSYRWRIEISSFGEGVGQLLVFPVGTSWVKLMLDGGRNQAHVSGLERVNGLLASAKENPTATTFRIEPGKKYLLELTVRLSGENADVAAEIDGQKLFQWSGPTKKLSLATPNQAPGATVLGILGVRPFTLHSLQLQAFEGGTVKLLRMSSTEAKLPNFVKLPEK